MTDELGRSGRLRSTSLVDHVEEAQAPQDERDHDASGGRSPRVVRDQQAERARRDDEQDAGRDEDLTTTRFKRQIHWVVWPSLMVRALRVGWIIRRAPRCNEEPVPCQVLDPLASLPPFQAPQRSRQQTATGTPSAGRSIFQSRCYRAESRLPASLWPLISAVENQRRASSIRCSASSTSPRR